MLTGANGDDAAVGDTDIWPASAVGKQESTPWGVFSRCDTVFDIDIFLEVEGCHRDKNTRKRPDFTGGPIPQQSATHRADLPPRKPRIVEFMKKPTLLYLIQPKECS